MRQVDRDWMSYIEGEVRAACEKHKLGYQVRRKWSVRDKPVSQSPVQDYEWKLIPGPNRKLPDQSPIEFDVGVYFVLSVDPIRGHFLLEHDTAHCGMLGPHWQRRTYTEIAFAEMFDVGTHSGSEEALRVAGAPQFPIPPSKGWLQRHLMQLTAQFKPNQFSYT